MGDEVLHPPPPPQSIEILCFELVWVGYVSSFCPRRDVHDINLFALSVCTFLVYRIQNPPRNNGTRKRLYFAAGYTELYMCLSCASCVFVVRRHILPS